MNRTFTLIGVLLSLQLTSCNANHLPTQTNNNRLPQSPSTTMNENITQSITHPTVRAAVEAWQNKDLESWLSFFSEDTVLLDDGNPRDFKAFSNEMGKEWFTSIDKVEDDGTSIYGQFHTESWGDFKTYFKFRMNSEGKFDQLEIGQASY